MKTYLLFCLMSTISVPVLSQSILHEVKLDNGKSAYLYDNGKWSYKLYDARPEEFISHHARSDNDSTFGIFGIPFGSRLSAVKDIMSNKGYSVDETVGDKLISYKGIKFGGRPTQYIFFKFNNDNLFECKVLFRHVLDSKTLELYNDIRDDVSNKYGTGSSFESYEYPYEKGDGHWETAVKIGKADITTYWSDHELVTISLEVKEDFTIELTYQDNALVRRAVDDQTQRNIKDY